MSLDKNDASKKEFLPTTLSPHPPKNNHEEATGDWKK